MFYLDFMFVCYSSCCSMKLWARSYRNAIFLLKKELLPIVRVNEQIRQEKIHKKTMKYQQLSLRFEDLLDNNKQPMNIVNMHRKTLNTSCVNYFYIDYQ